MVDFSLLGSLATQLHQRFVELFYILLPAFFALALVIDWFRNPAGSADFIDTLKRAFIATILVVSFQEIADAIIVVTSTIANEISDMSGLTEIFKMAGEKVHTYSLSPVSAILGFNDLTIAIISFFSYLILYVAYYIVIALYHFMWIFLSISAPLLILFNLFQGTSQITVNLFKSLIEVSCYKIVWAIMAAMLKSLAFGNAYMADGNYLTVIVLNLIIAIAMLCTPLIVKSLVGGGLSSVAQTLTGGAALAMVSAPARAAAIASRTTSAMGAAKDMIGMTQGRLDARYFRNSLNRDMQGLSANPPPPDIRNPYDIKGSSIKK